MKSLVFKLMFVYVDLIPFLKHIKTAANYFTNKLETVFPSAQPFKSLAILYCHTNDAS